MVTLHLTFSQQLKRLLSGTTKGFLVVQQPKLIPLMNVNFLGYFTALWKSLIYSTYLFVTRGETFRNVYFVTLRAEIISTV